MEIHWSPMDSQHKVSVILKAYPCYENEREHYSDAIMGAMASQITSLTIAYSTVYSGADQRKHQSSASLSFVREIQRRRMDSPHKWPLTWKMFPLDNVIMKRDIY